MEQIGKAANNLLGKDSTASPANLPSRQSKRSADVLPAVLDRQCDLDLPRKLFSGWTPSSGPREIVRAMTPPERSLVEKRGADLEGCLWPHHRSEEAAIKSLIAGTLGGFRAMRQVDDNALATVETTRFVLAEYPAWAISKACLMIARNEIKRDRRFAPNDAELCEIVAGIVRPYRDNLKRARALLDAPIERPHAETTDRPPPPVPWKPSISDGQHGSRVLADLEARKARAAAIADPSEGST